MTEQIATPTQTLYEQDYQLWLETTLELKFLLNVIEML
jgi:hypothetical protein